jgi:thiamine kinase-like enzyme
MEGASSPNADNPALTYSAYVDVCTDGHEAMLQTFVPHAVAELHKQGLWKGVCTEDVKCRSGWNRPWIGLLSPPDTSGEASVIMKFGLKYLAQNLAAHQNLAEAGVAAPLLAHWIAEDGNQFTLEAMGERRDSSDDWGDPSLYEDNALLTAKLHKTTTTWFDKFRTDILEKVPVLKDEPLNSAVWVLARSEMLESIKSAVWVMPPIDKLRQLLAAIPRPSGQHAEELVNVHGDLHHQNIVRLPAGGSVLVDLEGVCVSSAVQDLVHVCDRNLIAFYLGSMAGKVPSEEEVDALWLEALIAEHVHMYILRDVFWETCRSSSWDPEDVPAIMDRFIEHTTRFSSFAKKLRKDKALAKKVMGPGPEALGSWRDDCEEMMKSC